jgi:hypothetical protein
MNLKRIFALGLAGAALALAAVPAYADRDAVSFGSNIHVARDSSVHDAVCFFCSVQAEGEVQGDIVVFFGNIHLSGSARHDVVNFFGKVTVEDGVSIGQDLVSFFGVVRMGENVSVGKDMVAMFGSVRAPSSVTVGDDRVIQPGWILWIPLLIIGTIVFVIVREFRSYRHRRYMGRYPFPPPPPPQP